MTSFQPLQTRLLSVDDEQALPLALSLLKAGEAVVIPTETIFGLACDATNLEAVSRLYQIKQRPIEKPSAVFLPNVKELAQYAIVQHAYVYQVIEEFLPGPVTVVLRSRTSPWPGVVGRDGNIGIRVSSDPFVKRLTSEFGKPLIATSANVSSEKDFTSIEDLGWGLTNKIQLVIYREKIIAATPSTVVDLTGDRPKLIREGVVAFEKILRFAEKVATS